MEVEEGYLKRKIAEFRQVGEKNRLDATANFGAADGLQLVLDELLEKAKVTKPIEETKDA